jgi:hypothetical protein
MITVAELTEREKFVLEAATKGKGLKNGKSWQSLLRKGLVSGSPESPSLTPSGRKSLDEIAAAAVLQEAGAENEDAEGVPPADKRKMKRLVIGVVAASLFLLVCGFTVSQYGRLRSAEARVKALSLRVSEQEKTLAAAEGPSGEVDSVSREETNARVLEIQKHLREKMLAMQAAKRK